MITIQAPAKINIYLEVKRRREDGYHDIESIMQTVSLCDSIVLEPRPSGLTLECNWSALPTDERNLALRAALLLRERLAVSRGAHIRLMKTVPLGAGLGGGSSDAAAVLRGLLQLWDAELPAEELSLLAARLGADVPFFLSGGTGVAEGVGERITPLSGVAPAAYVLVYPRVAVPTAGVYRGLRFPLTNEQKISRMKHLLSSGAASREWENCLFNRLEDVVLPRYEQVRLAKETLAGLGYRSLMSGSGSTVFSPIPSMEDGMRIRSELGRYPWDVHVVESV